MAGIQIKPHLKLALPLDRSFIRVSQSGSLFKPGGLDPVTSNPVHPKCTPRRTSEMCCTPTRHGS